MRLSPALMAALALAATFGWSNSAQAQTRPTTTKPSDPVPPMKSLSMVAKSVPATIVKTKPIQKNVVVRTLSVPEVANSLSKKRAEPPKLAQGSDIEQETPNQIQINPGSPIPTAPSSPSVPTRPNIPVPTQPAPAPEGQPIPTPTPEGQPTPEVAPGEQPTEIQPTNPSQPGEQAPPTTETEAEPRVLVGEVQVVGASPELQTEVYRVIRTGAGRTTTRSLLQEDINAIFATGFFSNVRATPTDTPLGAKSTAEIGAGARRTDRTR
jgi:outer membrane protein insertion porin family